MWTATPPSRFPSERHFAFSRMCMPSASRISRTAWETSSSSLPINRGPISTIVTSLPKRETFRIQPDVYALSLQDFAHRLGDVFVLSSNQSRPHLDNRNFASEAAIDLGELQPNITSADDDEMLGQEIDVHDR